MNLVSNDTPAAADELRVRTHASPRWWHLSASQAALIVLWSGFFFWLNRLPLQPTGFWSHAAYGRWILEQQALPVADPFAPLLAAKPLFDGAWLSQVILGKAAAWGGGEALSLLFAGSVLIACLILARVFYLQSRSALLAHAGVVLACVLGWDRITTARPEMFGMVCFSGLLWLLVRDRIDEGGETPNDETGRRIAWELWIGVPLLMMLWANLHDSFVCGLLILACWMGGRGLETAWRKRSLRAVLADRALRRRVWIGELALAATCLNPYGARLLWNALWFADYRQLEQLADWEPIELLGPGGRGLLICLLLAMLVFRHSRRPVPAADALWLAGFSFVFGNGMRMAWWWAAIFVVVMMPHFTDLWSRLLNTISRSLPSDVGNAVRSVLGSWAVRRWSYSAVAVILAWILFAVSPAGSTFINQSPRPPERLYGATTPWRLSQYLREEPPRGPVFNPDFWGDWLAWDGPPGLWIFMTSNMHLASADVWTDYRIVRENRVGWNNVLARYGIRTVVVDNYRQRILRGYLSQSSDWQVVYEDELGTVFRREERKEQVEQP